MLTLLQNSFMYLLYMCKLWASPTKKCKRHDSKFFLVSRAHFSPLLVNVAAATVFFDYVHSSRVRHKFPRRSAVSCSSTTAKDRQRRWINTSGKPNCLAVPLLLALCGLVLHRWPRMTCLRATICYFVSAVCVWTRRRKLTNLTIHSAFDTF